MTTPHTPTKAKPPASEKVYKSTPVRKSLQGSEHFATLSRPDAELLKKNMAGELAGQWVGPMPANDFISSFFPHKSAKPRFKPNFFDVLAKQDHESSMYDPFIKHVTTTAPTAIEGFKLINTSQYEDRDIDIPGMKNKPDVSCYKAACRVDPKRPTRYEDIQLIFEFKTWKEEADPFEDHPGKAEEENLFPFEAQAEVRRQCRGQIACYARVWCARQHRTHCFVVWIADPHARIIRFDRSGAIVSEKFNYREDGDILLDFLWSFSHSDDAIRGLDPTITKASPADAQAARKALRMKWKPTSNRSVFEVQVPVSGPNGDTNSTRPFFVWGPLSDPRSVTGRATRGYPAWDPKGDDGKGGVVFLKDSWRSTEPGMEKEVDILKELHEKKCRHVPELVCGDDLPNQTTVTQKYATKRWNIGAKADKFVQRIHTRFVEKNVGTHLASESEIEKGMHSKKFLKIVFDAFIAHYDAYVLCGILHRDISAGNILVDEDGKGFLNDWDLSKHITNPVVRQVFRSGTWQYMSAALLRDAKKLNTLQDDLESFFWLITFHILRYMANSQPGNLETLMRDIFDSEVLTAVGEDSRGGNPKYSLINDYIPVDRNFKVIGNEALTSFFHSCLYYLKKWYSHMSSYKDDVQMYALVHHVTYEFAETQIPLYTANVPMDTHQVMMDLFKAALRAPETQWPNPKVDVFLDRLAPPEKRKREGDGEESQTDTDAGEDSTRTSSETGQPKKTVKRKEDAEYKGIAPVNPLPSLETRQQKRLRELGPGGSHPA